MQITPETASYIAHLSGGTAFEQGDLSTPQVNISYGAFYLRYLLQHYERNTVLALAAYNGGEGNVDRWLAEASTSERAFGKEQIPFPETREYVDRVLAARTSYREKYSRELGLQRTAPR
jgi:soluble lytic murein transglycosylase